MLKFIFFLNNIYWNNYAFLIDLILALQQKSIGCISLPLKTLFWLINTPQRHSVLIILVL